MLGSGSATGANFPSGPGVIDDGNAAIHTHALKLALPPRFMPGVE